MAFLDREPNNEVSQAVDLGSLSFSGLSIGGRMDNFEDNLDRYKFRLPKAALVEFSLPGGNDSRNQTRFSPINNSISIRNKAGTSFSTKQVLLAGEYTATVSNRLQGSVLLPLPKREDFPLANYGAVLKTTPVAKTELRIRVRDLDGGGQIFDPFALFSGNAEFYVSATVNGKTTRSPVFKNDTNRVLPNFTLKFNVDPSQSVIPIKLDVFDADPFNDERLNSNNLASTQKGGWDLEYNVSQNRLEFAGSNQSIGQALSQDKNTPFNRVLVNSCNSQESCRQLGPFADGNGSKNAKQVLTVFNVEYEHILADPSALFSKSSTAKGDSKSNSLTGTGASGILDGGKGNDDLSGMGGNDALVGGDGDDILRGGKGSDTLWGGKGSDTYFGGQGRDYFVLDLLKGVDVIKDFQNGKDAIALTDGLVFDALELQQEDKHLGVYFNQQKLAFVENTTLDQIDSSDFVQADFTRVKGIRTAFVA